MLSHPQKLTQLAISKMLQGDAQDQDMIVQVFDINTTKNGRVMCSISDGQYYTKAYLNDDKIVKPTTDQFSIVRVKSHGVLKNNIGVTDLKFVVKYPEKLGTPVDWSSCKENAVDMKSSKEFKLEKIQKVQKVQKTETKKMEMPSAAKTTSGKQSEYQSIDDLHIGLNRWTILCRITKKQFKQSAKKGTKILQIQLVDKSKKRIIGTFFHEAAVDFNDYLREGAIYEISKGRITEGDYNNSKNQKFSPYRLTFDGKSQFNEVSDVNIIAKSQDTAITLGNLYERKTLNQQFDVVAYIVEIKQQSTFQKDGKQFKVKQIVVADPQANITMKVSLWRWIHEVGADMVGKVVIFSRFILKQYKGSLTLHSGIRSSIITTHGHSMKKYQNHHLDISSFTQVSASSEHHERVDEDTSQFCFNTKELNQKINHMGYHDTIKSILFVWVNRFAISRKWNYEGCPKCKKAAEKYTKCGSCGYAIQETALHFSMGVEVSDGFGAIWITAYDQLAKKIFADMGSSAAKQLQELQRDALNEKLENYAYQPFRIKIMTKKDEQGRIRHNAGKLFELNQDKVAKQNMKKIYSLMRISH